MGVVVGKSPCLVVALPGGDHLCLPASHLECFWAHCFQEVVTSPSGQMEQEDTLQWVGL